eukprot:904698-Prymnesium_polylepis.1
MVIRRGGGATWTVTWSERERARGRREGPREGPRETPGTRSRQVLKSSDGGRRRMVRQVHGIDSRVRDSTANQRDSSRHSPLEYVLIARERGSGGTTNIWRAS